MSTVRRFRGRKLPVARVLDCLPPNRVVRAEDVARELGLSERTVRRYVGVLRLEGHRIDGERAIGLMRRPARTPEQPVV